MSISQRQIIQLVNKLDEPPAPLSEDVAGLAFCFLLIAIPLFWTLVIFFELKIFDIIFCKKGSKMSTEDDLNQRRQSLFKGHAVIDDQDIVEEQDRVRARDAGSLPVRIQDVRKNYGGVKAVRNVSFGLDYGECFALLGISGAGKTSIFKCLTGETYPTSGDVSINGFDVTTSGGFAQARKQIGYCPQFDAIFDGLTVLEHLQIYASLKAIKSSVRDALIKKAIIDMDL